MPGWAAEVEKQVSPLRLVVLAFGRNDNLFCSPKDDDFVLIQGSFASLQDDSVERERARARAAATATAEADPYGMTNNQGDDFVLIHKRAVLLSHNAHSCGGAA
jgi:hypothetical protein